MKSAMKNSIGCAIFLFATTAVAYQYDVSQEGERTYAKEIFGAGSDDLVIGYQDEAPKLTLTLTLTQSEAAEIDEGDSAEITMMLANAVLARSLRSSSFNVTPATVPINIRDREGGARGDDSVTFEIVSTGTLSLATGTVVNFVWELPPLMGLNPNRPVTATVEVDAGGGSGFKGSDDETVTVDVASTHKSTSGVLRRAAAAAADGSRASVPLINFADALTFGAGSGYVSNINIIGRRATVSASTPFFVRGYAVLAWGGGGVNSPNILQRNGRTFSIASRQDGAGSLVVSVAGQFHNSGDSVWLDMNGNWLPDSGEMLSLSGGVFSGRFSLVEVAGNRRITGDSPEQRRQREEGPNYPYLLYIPNGTEPLRPAQYTSTFSVDFADRGNRDYTGALSQVVNMRTQYTSIDSTATRRAYAVPPLDSSDTGNIRVKCETAVACPLYLECDDSAGESWFQQLSESVPGRTTLRLTPASIAEHLGVGEDGWQGRLSCSVMSTQDISVQVLTRSNGVLVNNTYIDTAN